MISEKVQVKPAGYPAVDWFRIVAALLVVANHTSPLLSLTDTGDFILTRVLARLAVPFFFMASGYFLVLGGGGAAGGAGGLGRTGGPLTARRVGAFSKRLALMYGAAILVYLPLNLYMGYFSQPGLFPGLLKDILWNGTFYHLWYFPAALLGVWVAFGLWRLCSYKGALAIAGALYLLGVGGDSWYNVAAGVPVLGGFYQGLFTMVDYTRSGLFFAPLFLLMGMAVAEHRANRPANRPASGPSSRPAWFDALGLALSFGLMTAEALLLRSASANAGGMRHDSMYLALPAAAFFLFSLLLRPRGESGATGAMLRKVSMLVYLIHPWCIVLVRGAARAVGLTWLAVEVSPVFYLLVSAASVGLAFLLWLLGRWWGQHGPGHRARPPQDRLRRTVYKKAAQRAWAEVDGDALAHNLAQLRPLLPPGGEIMAVVKAEAYGHGAVWAARRLRRQGVRAFAVATMAEGVKLRRHGLRGSILVLGYTPPEYARTLWLYRLTQTAVDAAHAEALSAQGLPLQVHLKVDSGMHRLGEAAEHVDAIAGLYALPHLRVTGLFTHLSASDSHLPDDVVFTDKQIAAFYALAEALRARGIEPGGLHLQSSYGLLNRPGLPCRWARVGIALYGSLSSPADVTKRTVDLRPVLALRARVAAVRRVPAGQSVGYGRAYLCTKDSLVATVTIGYGDGIPRCYTGGRVLIRGKSLPVIGRICMDQLAVLANDAPNLAPGDVATLIGADGGEAITAAEMAAQCGTLANEIFSRLGPRVRRVAV